MWETWIRCQVGKTPGEKGMVTHSSILARRIPWTEEPQRNLGCYSPWGHKELDTTEQLTLSLHFPVFYQVHKQQPPFSLPTEYSE